MKKIQILVILMLVLVLTGCKKSDAVKFKEEYESLNGTGDYREISINKDNPMVYISAEDLATKIENQEDMVVYFGFNKCPWCRSMIETLLKVASDLKIEKIYYVDVYDIRDAKEIKDGEVTTTKEGSKGYNKIIELSGNNLAEYKIDDQVVGRRIYAPNILVIRDKKIEGVIEGISELLTDPKMELTDEMKNDSYNMIHELLEKYTRTACSEQGC